MGDLRRNEIFAHFIRMQFSPKKFPSVLVVADGKGELAQYLSKWYRRVRVIENQPRQIFLRKKVTYTKGYFTSLTPVEESFIVAMHPDEATSEVVKSGKYNSLRWAIVPCCVKGTDTHGIHNYRDWLIKLAKLAHMQTKTTQLPFNGKNTVLWV